MQLDNMVLLCFVDTVMEMQHEQTYTNSFVLIDAEWSRMRLVRMYQKMLPKCVRICMIVL